MGKHFFYKNVIDNGGHLHEFETKSFRIAHLVCVRVTRLVRTANTNKTQQNLFSSPESNPTPKSSARGLAVWVAHVAGYKKSSVQLGTSTWNGSFVDFMSMEMVYIYIF